MFSNLSQRVMFSTTFRQHHILKVHLIAAKALTSMHWNKNSKVHYKKPSQFK